MSKMFFSLLIGSFIIILSVVVQAYGNILWLKKISPSKGLKIPYTPRKPLQLLSYSFIFFSIIHFIQTGFWAIAYILIPETNHVFNSISEAWYFSMVTFTSLGYGDITLTENWRLLSGIEAINGIMLIGWSTAMMFSLIQQIYKSQNSN